MTVVRYVLLFAALLCFLLAGIGVTSPRGSSLVGMGLFLWVLATLVRQ